MLVKTPNALPKLGLDENELEFGDAQVKELAFQQKNKLKRKVQALKAGHLLASEIDGDLVAELQQYDKRQATNYKARVCDRNRALSKVIKKDVKLRGLRWWPVTGQQDTPDIARMMIHHGLMRAESSATADVFLTGKNPAALPRPLRLAACLNGALACNVEYIRQEGKAGLSLSYLKATKVKRFVSMTEGFIERAPECAQVLLDVLGLAGQTWRLASIDALLGHLGPDGAQKKQPQVLLFAMEADLPAEELHGAIPN